MGSALIVDWKVLQPPPPPPFLVPPACMTIQKRDQRKIHVVRYFLSDFILAIFIVVLSI